MKRIVSADLFALRKSKMIWLLPLGAILLGFLMPMMYYGIKVLFDYLGSIDELKDNPAMASMTGMLGILDTRTVFLASLPLSQGFGLMMTAMIGFRAARPFGTGIYRNEVIARIPRSSIYLSQSLICLLLSLIGAALYTLSAALTSRLTFGTLDLSGKEVLSISVLSFGIYLVYTAIPVFVAFLTRSVPLTLTVSILLPVLAQTAVSLISPAMISAPETLINILSAFPAFQGVFMAGASGSDTVLIIALAADLVWAALLTVFGILRFNKTDVK